MGNLKCENSHGVGNWLDNEYEFNEFLDYCDKLKKNNENDAGYCKCSS